MTAAALDGDGGVRAGADGLPGVRGRRPRATAGARWGWSTRRAFGRPVRVVWRKRSWRCREPACPVGAFTEQDERVAAPRALLTMRACWWAIGQLRREHASSQGSGPPARHRRGGRCGTRSSRCWRQLAADPARFDGVTILGVDEHIWHHVRQADRDGGRGPKELTGMVDLTRDQHGRTRARLLDLVPGRSGQAYADWLDGPRRGVPGRVAVATLDPFHGYKNAIDDQLDDAVAVLDAFHVVKLGSQAVDEVRRRVQQDTTATAAARTTRSTGSGTSCAAPRNGSPTANRPGSPRRSPPTNATSRSTSPGSAPSSSAQVYHQDNPAAGRRLAEQDPRPASRPARSPRSPASAAP